MPDKNATVIFGAHKKQHNHAYILDHARMAAKEQLVPLLENRELRLELQENYLVAYGTLSERDKGRLWEYCRGYYLGFISGQLDVSSQF